MTSPADDENDGDRRLLAAMAYRPRDHRRLVPIVAAACDLRTVLAAALGMPPGQRGDPTRPLPAWAVVTDFGLSTIRLELTAAAARALAAHLPPPPPPPPARRRRRA